MYELKLNSKYDYRCLLTGGSLRNYTLHHNGQLDKKGEGVMKNALHKLKGKDIVDIYIDNGLHVPTLQAYAKSKLDGRDSIRIKIPLEQLLILLSYHTLSIRKKRILWWVEEVIPSVNSTK